MLPVLGIVVSDSILIRADICGHIHHTFIIFWPRTSPLWSKWKAMIVKLVTRVSTEFRRLGIPRNFLTSEVISAQFRRNSAKFRGIPRNFAGIAPEITSVFRGMPKCHFRGHPTCDLIIASDVRRLILDSQAFTYQLACFGQERERLVSCRSTRPPASRSGWPVSSSW